MDLSRAYQEVKSLPDEALTKELSQPSGMVPSYLVMAELEDRKAIRSSTPQQGKKTSMKDDLLNDINPMGFASGGLVQQTNPFYYSMLARMNPEVAASQMQEQMMQANRGYYPTNSLQAPQAPQPPAGISGLVPGAPAMSGSLQEPRYAAGGVVRKPGEGGTPTTTPQVANPTDRVSPASFPFGAGDNNMAQSGLQGFGPMAEIFRSWLPQEANGTSIAQTPTPIKPGLQDNGGITPGPIPLPHQPSPAMQEFLRRRSQ